MQATSAVGRCRAGARAACRALRPALLLALLGVSAPLAALPAHYLVLEEDAAGRIEPLFLRQVEVAGATWGEVGEPALAAGGGAEDPLEVELWDGDGRLVLRRRVAASRLLRGEFHAAAGRGVPIEGHRFSLGRRVFPLRLPALAEGRLVVVGRGRRELDLGALVAGAARLPLARLASGSRRLPHSRRAGNPANRVDLVILGDGYRGDQESRFAADAARLENELFALSPYREYRNFVNVSHLFTPSAEEGADHPPYDAACIGDDRSCCSDPTALSDPRAGTYVDTVFGGRYCAFMVHRLAVVEVGAVLAAASEVPDWDLLLVLLDDPTYGGSGGSVAVISTHELAVAVAQHEIGHSFSGLADEYDSPYPGYPPCSDVGPRPCEPNVTDQRLPALIKWWPWIDAGTPLPTPEGDPRWRDAVGLFEGARYQTDGLFRPVDSRCLMRLLGLGFGEICAQQYVIRLYSGGWGVPAEGIDPIEPGSEAPPPGDVVVVAVAGPDGTAPVGGDGVTLGVDLLQPEGGPPLAVTWSLDGEPLTGESGPRLSFVPPAPGLFEVEVEARDVTPLVHPRMAPPSLASRRRWNVAANAAPFFDDFEDDLLPDGWTLVRGRWSEAEGSLRGVPEGGNGGRPRARSLVSPAFAGCGPGRVEADLEGLSGAGTPPPGSYLRLAAWHSDAGSQVTLTLFPVEDRAVLEQRQAGVLLLRREAPVGLETEHPYRLALDFDGEQLTVFLDGALLFDVAAAGERPPFGGVGFEAQELELRLHRLDIRPRGFDAGAARHDRRGARVGSS